MKSLDGFDKNSVGFTVEISHPKGWINPRHGGGGGGKNGGMA